jgi:hypothetical protein
LLQPDEILFSGLGAMEKQHWCSHLVPFTANADEIFISTSDPAWRLFKIVYIVCDGDYLIPDSLQQAVSKTAQKHGALLENEFLEDYGHSPNLTAPESIVVVLAAAAARCSRDSFSRRTSAASFKT